MTFEVLCSSMVLPSFFGTMAAICNSQVPNEITMQHEPLEKRELLRYIHKRRQQSLYRAAARLWGGGLAWDRAIAIVREAFDHE